MLYAAGCLLGCLPELSTNQPSRSYALLCRDPIMTLTNIDLVAFILTQRHASVLEV